MLLDADTLPHTCSIRSISYARDSDEGEPRIGGDYPTATNRLTDQPCWVQTASRSAVRDYQRRDQRLTHTVYFGEDVALTVGEEIKPDSPAFTTKVLRVLDYGECTAGLSVGWKAECEQKEDSVT